MPVLRTETIHGWPCKFYDNGTVNVGTRAADRFSIKVPPDEGAWFATRLRAELIERELATEEELPTDEAGEAAMAAKAAAKAREAASKAAKKRVDEALAAEARAAAARDTARYHEAVAGQKRQLAELDHKIAVKTVKLAKAVPLVAGLVQELPELAQKAAAPLQAKLESFFRPRPRV